MGNTYQSLAIEGGPVEFRVLPGDMNLPVLVLLHEGLGCVALWRDFPDRLNEATGHPVLLYSRVGYGGSAPRALPWPLDYMQREGVDVLPQVLAAAGIEECVLVGHSDGASIALAYAGGVEDSKASALVVMAPHVFTEESGLASIRAVRGQYVEGLREKLATYHGENVDCAFRGWSEVWTHPDFKAWNIEAFLPGITVPVLQIQGADDQYGTSAQLRAIEHGVTGPCQSELLANCRHAPQFEQAARTVELITRFLERHGLSS